ncbi:MAG: ribbon-helix-helix protein, CopG family [Promethearchaeota archaeon]
MTNLSIRMKKEMIDELDRIAKLLGVNRTTIVRKIIHTGIEQQKIEVAIDLFQKGDTLERAANISGAYLWDLFEELKNRGITSKFDIDQEKETYLRVFGKNNENLKKRIKNLPI